MSESTESKTPKGDFIDLDKGQYRKNYNFKKYILIFSVILIIVISLFLYFINFNFKIFIKDNDTTDNVFDSSVKRTSSINPVEIKRINFVEKEIENLTKEILDNKIKLSETDKTISELRKQLANYENRNIRNSDFFYSEKYIILNNLLNLKNKFDKRQNIKKELENLISRFDNKPEVKSLIIYLQEVKIEEVYKVEDLLDRLNKKINFYEQDIDEFVTDNLEGSFDNEVFDSRENFISYFKNLINSTYKVTKINDVHNSNIDIPIPDYNFLKTLIKAKEYLLIGNIEKSVEILKKSNFGNSEMYSWIDDALILLNTKDRLKALESMLLENISEDIN